MACNSLADVVSGSLPVSASSSEGPASELYMQGQGEVIRAGGQEGGKGEVVTTCIQVKGAWESAEDGTTKIQNTLLCNFIRIMQQMPITSIIIYLVSKHNLWGF